MAEAPQIAYAGTTDLLLPARAPEAAELIFRLGALTKRQAAWLWPAPYSEESSRRLSRQMLHTGLLRRNRCAVVYSPANAHQLGVPAYRRGPRWVWEDIYSLTIEGVRYVADVLELPLSQTRARYNRSYSDGRREHVYLRNEAYSLIAEGLARTPGIELHRLEAEGGAGRIKLPVRQGRKLRYAEPDGLIQVTEDLPGGRSTHSILVESDTGTQDSVRVIADKLESYAEWYVAGGSETTHDVSEHPPVLFVSPTTKRSDTVSYFVEQAAERNPESYLMALHRARERAGFEDGALDVFGFTSLQLLRERGGWGPAYQYLADESPGPLLRRRRYNS